MRTSRIVRPLAVGLLVLLALLPACASQDAGSMAGLINGARADAGLAPLALDDNASQIAQEWSASMAASNTLNHNPSLGSAIDSRVGTGWVAYAENVAYNGSHEGAYSAFMASDGHRANILNPSFDRMGIGIVQDGGTFWVTVVFVGY